MFAYQKNNRYFAQIAGGLESLGAAELAELGADEIKKGFKGIYFSAGPAELYRINYQTRLCTRILAPLLSFDCHSTKYLYKTALKLDWQKLLDPDTTFAVKATVAQSRIRHSQYAALCLKDAVADYFRNTCGVRPDVDTMAPDVRLNIHIERNRAVISLDTSAGSLHRRGYRQESVEAPMQETTAAAIIRLTGWNGEVPLLDPMCGSGTLLSEALLHYCRIPAGYLRKRFGFEALPDFEKDIWKRVKDESDRRIRKLPAGLLEGRDISGPAIRAARKNNKLLPGGAGIVWQTGAFQDSGRREGWAIVCNPPYGIRLGGRDQSGKLFKEFGDFLKWNCPGSTAYIYFGRRELLKKIGLKPSWKKPLAHGGLDGVLAKYYCIGMLFSHICGKRN